VFRSDMNDMFQEENKKVYTVTELTRDIKTGLESSFPEIWVEGEISNLHVQHSSGHQYFSLKDENSILKCVFFRNAKSKLKFQLEDGMKILCYGRISVYEKQGQYQLYVDAVEAQGKGALQVAFEQLKLKLYKEGLFDEARKRPIPLLPLRVAVVTSPTGAAVRDILKVARKRFANIEITIYPVKVQGEGAKEEIASAIQYLNEYNNYIDGTDEHKIDVMIVGRGGGSIEDLWAFNEEMVARAIFSSDIPVISAVGHEIDFTIADFVADMRAATPSAAAEIVIPEKDVLLDNVNASEERLSISIKTRMDTLQERIRNLADNYVMRAPMNVLDQFRQSIDDAEKKLNTLIGHSVEIAGSEFMREAEKLAMLNPLGVLSRGYSITFLEDKAIRNPGGIKPGSTIRTVVEYGQIESRVEKITEGSIFPSFENFKGEK